MKERVGFVRFIRRCCLLVFSILMICAMGSEVYAAQQSDWTGNVNFFLGAKVLDEDDWEPAEEQDEFGIEVDFKQRNWPVSIAIDFLYGSGDGTIYGVKCESETTELNIGIRNIWDQSPHVRPFIGVGIAFISAEASVPWYSVDDSSVGIWFGGGVYWTLGESFNIGLEAKYSTAEVTFNGFDVEAGGRHFGMLIGFHW